MQRIEEGAAGERARVCSRPDGKAGLDFGHQSSPVLSWFSIWPCVANVVAEAKVHVSMRFVGSFCGFCKQLRPIKRALCPTTFLEIAVVQILLVHSICYTKKISQTIFSLLYYCMRNFCNLIGLEQWYFSLI